MALLRKTRYFKKVVQTAPTLQSMEEKVARLPSLWVNPSGQAWKPIDIPKSESYQKESSHNKCSSFDGLIKGVRVHVKVALDWSSKCCLVFIHRVSFKVFLLMRKSPLDTFAAVQNIFPNLCGWGTGAQRSHLHCWTELVLFSWGLCVCRWREQKQLWSHNKGKRASVFLFQKKWQSHSLVKSAHVLWLHCMMH